MEKIQLKFKKNMIEKDQKVVICDDLLATGGTAKASGKLIEKVGGRYYRVCIHNRTNRFEWN